jgi:glucuronokinase
MLLIRKHAFARAGLIGNPSDGYHGKTISLTVRDFSAQVVLYEWDDIEIVWSQEDRSRFRSVHDLARDVDLHGYYGGVRLVKATIKRFVEYCDHQGHRLHDRNFSIRYHSSIPRQLGLGGSSAIIIATLRCLMDFYEVEIPRHVLPSLALAVETKELAIAAGLQDRVIQVYEGMVYMDFARDRMREVCGYPHGVYEPLDPALLPPLYLAFSDDASEPTETVHNNLRARFDRGEPEVLAAMVKFAELAAEARQTLQAGNHARLGELMDLNFDTRRSICRIPRRQLEIVELARRIGATAKFAGSGGAIIGTYRSPSMFSDLQAGMKRIACRVIRPTVGLPGSPN